MLDTKPYAEYKNDPIALYGLGTETERALRGLEGYEVVGLLDGFREEGKLYGKEIISLDRCVQAGVRLIIVVARPGSCRAIAKKIGAFCEEHEIRLLDIRGRNLMEQKRVTYSLDGVVGYTRAELMELAGRADAVSFDLFDTLIMRKTLLPTDVIELLEFRLRERGIYIDDFVNRRMWAEKELSRTGAPFLEEIYRSVLEQVSPVPLTAGELAELEWELDCELILPRQEMVDVLSEIRGQGKCVCIVTDSYYRQDQIERMLTRCGIDGCDSVLVSCEYHTGKGQRLFAGLRELLGGRSCLHVGDDPYADVESARREGLMAFHVYSGADLLEQIGNLGVSADTLCARLKLGMLVCGVFNSPFQFEEPDKTLHVDSDYEIGYWFLAPMITDFVLWFADEVERRRLKNVWFCARDGYLIQKLYEFLHPGSGTVYFLTSRMAALRAGMESEEDIRYIGSMKFSGTLSQQLKERFGITVEEEEVKGRGLMDYADLILRSSKQKRTNNRSYVESLTVEDGDIAFFDFVAKGTSQMYCSRLAENHLEGLYFLQLEKDFMRDKGLDITPFYDESERNTSAIYEEYYILETILTSPEPSVLEFNAEGKPCYAKETRSGEDITCFMQVQAGITDYFEDYLRLCPGELRKPDKATDETLLRLIHSFHIRDEAFRNLTVEDPFFNRTTAIQDLL